MQCPDEIPGRGDYALGFGNDDECFGQAKVHQFDNPLRVDQDVAGLHVDGHALSDEIG